MNEWAAVIIAAFAAGISLYAVIKGGKKDAKSELKEEAQEVKTDEREKTEVSIQMTLMLGKIDNMNDTMSRVEKQTCRIEDRILDHERRLVRLETLSKLKEE